MCQSQRFLGLLAGKILSAKIHQKHVAVGAPGDDAQTAFLQHLCHHARIVDHLLLVILEFLGGGFLESHRLGSNYVHQWSALGLRENS